MLSYYNNTCTSEIFNINISDLCLNYTITIKNSLCTPIIFKNPLRLGFYFIIYFYHLCRTCLGCKSIFLIRKTDFKWVIKGYWYTNTIYCYHQYALKREGSNYFYGNRNALYFQYSINCTGSFVITKLRVTL